MTRNGHLYVHGIAGYQSSQALGSGFSSWGGPLEREVFFIWYLWKRLPSTSRSGQLRSRLKWKGDLGMAHSVGIRGVVFGSAWRRLGNEVREGIDEERIIAEVQCDET